VCEGIHAVGETTLLKPERPPGQQMPDDEEAWARVLSDSRFGQGEFLGTDRNDRRPIAIAEQRSVLARFGHSEGMLVCELAFALAKTDLTPDGLGVKPGAIVGVGVETPERGAGEPGGDGRGGMGGPPGGGMGGPGASAEQKQIKAWTTVQLAVMPS